MSASARDVHLGIRAQLAKGGLPAAWLRTEDAPKEFFLLNLFPSRVVDSAFSLFRLLLAVSKTPP
jgi:hypothetical protein